MNGFVVPMTRVPASGVQHLLAAGDYTAVVASVGASLRSLTFKGRDLVVPFAADEVRPAYRGVTLVPWPNRVVDGRYDFAGLTHTLSLTEPERGHALHGLGVWLAFDRLSGGADEVTLGATIEPQAGYPWRLAIETTYRLSPDGLTQSVRACNLSEEPAPYGAGWHPYLVAGAGPLDEWTLHLEASDVLHVSADRLVPTGLHAVDSDGAERFDFRVPRRIGPVQIDHAFTGLARGADGMATVSLTAADGAGVAMSWDRSCPWVQVFTADRPNGAADPSHRGGLAVEPLTCAPDAFNAVRYDHPTGLANLSPGGEATATWWIGAIDPSSR